MKSSGYISKAACRGYRPQRLFSKRLVARPRLIAQLARERGVARFIVAPSGYGKSLLAAEYAETMHSWANTFFLNAQSPCFIRDLDEGDIASECFAVDPSTRLVIIDDLPLLDAERAKQLSKEIDDLVAGGSEVIVTLAPSRDLFGVLQRDRVCLGAENLLLDDEEVAEAMVEEGQARPTASDTPPAKRVPAMVWGAEDGAVEAFVAGNLGEEVPADLLLAMCAAFVLHQGDLSCLTEFGPIDLDLVEAARSDYPHLGFDVEEWRFEAPLIDVEVLPNAVRLQFDKIVERSNCESRRDLILAWADVLLKRCIDASRACDVVRVFCATRIRAAWFLENARLLMRRGCFHPSYRLISSLSQGKYEHRGRVRAVESLCRRMLGDPEGSVRLAKKCAFERSSEDEVRALGLLITARFASGDLRNRAQDALTAWAAELEAGLDDGRSDPPPWHEALVRAWHARDSGVEGLADVWASSLEAGVDDDALCVVASWLFKACEGESPDRMPVISQIVAPVERYVRDRLSEGGDRCDFFTASAGLSMEEAHQRGMPYRHGPIRASVLLGLRRVEMEMLIQRQAFQRDRRHEQTRRGASGSASHASSLLPAGLEIGERASVPLLTVRMFDQFMVSIEGNEVATTSRGRKHSRVLLVLLAINRGHDMSRDEIAAAMWPNSSKDVAKKNFYTVWSELRRALTLPDGTCPYLVRHQFGCRIDERYVKSDVARLDDICRELLFGRLDFEEWLALYNEIDRDFSGDLLPMEQKNHLIVKARNDCRSRLVDALVAATQRLIDSGNSEWGIWFARTAIDHDRLREDAYVALMRAQAASNQRTAAMMTYLNCRKTLIDELGVDPSPETTALYEQLIKES